MPGHTSASHARSTERRSRLQHSSDSTSRAERALLPASAASSSGGSAASSAKLGVEGPVEEEDERA